MRLNKPLTEPLLDEIKERFSDITSGKGFRFYEGPIESDAEIYPEKPRLVFNFNMKSYGKMIRLIQFINAKVA